MSDKITCGTTHYKGCECHEAEASRVREDCARGALRLAVYADAFASLLALTDKRSDHVSQLVAAVCREMLAATDKDIANRTQA